MLSSFYPLSRKLVRLAWNKKLFSCSHSCFIDKLNSTADISLNSSIQRRSSTGWMKFFFIFSSHNFLNYFRTDRQTTLTQNKWKYSRPARSHSTSSNGCIKSKFTWELFLGRGRSRRLVENFDSSFMQIYNPLRKFVKNDESKFKTFWFWENSKAEIFTVFSFWVK